mmetsp:Transcript_9177/g.13328  ORF Transcript_9177/g.13328 Transcript_9177/m.13328 type:complete len:335 (-) Transcript_9177:351-1355(-)|eukprot:CAMPEP_0195523632 /NCGR_PEP_ID=MMETSP0794_2-20130614/22927_1 /TAXON_ID=515487 /ORGANISM="Stephanopyxis turris, Strain CCMP 815" /LENGTH=334 /DNA_ID=CAMNT_0040653665 /DNA_START=55 /DNA_END=1059 /DNA_ORIENTATION=+
MKTPNKLLALLIFHPNVWVTAAFFVRAPNAITCKDQTIVFSSPYGNSNEGTEVRSPTDAVQSADRFFLRNINDPETATGALVRNDVRTPPNIDIDLQQASDIWFDTFESLPPTKIQGGALRTWSFPTSDLDRVYLALTTEGPPEGPVEGNPLNCSVTLNQGPNNAPQIMNVRSEKARLRPFFAMIETPRGSNTVFIRNLTPMSFPALARVGPNPEDVMEGYGNTPDLVDISNQIYSMGRETIIQGSAVQTYDLSPSVESVRIGIRSEGRPMHARIELIQGPDATKYEIDLYAEDGRERPFFAVLMTPGEGNAVRIVNTGSSQFPFIASVGPPRR